MSHTSKASPKKDFIPKPNTFQLAANPKNRNQLIKVCLSVYAACYLLLSQLDLVELLHVLLVVLLLELSDEAQLLLWAVGVLLSSVLLKLHCCLRIQCRHYLLSGGGKQNTGEDLVRKEIQETEW